jgi:phospholipid/cholesterol/gamma-HCH transport system substrate-binding protein
MTTNRKVMVGLFVVGGFFLFALGLFWIGDRRLLFSKNLELQTQFANLSGLKVGSKVMVSGMDAGEVLMIQVPPGPKQKFLLRFRVVARFQPILRQDSLASIQVEGLVGSKVLQIEGGSEQSPQAGPGTTLPSREPLEIGAIVQQAVDVLKQVNSAVDEIQVRAVKTIDIINDVGQQTQKMVGQVRADSEEIFGTGRRVAKDVGTIVEDVKKGKGFVGKLLTDDKLYTRLEKTAQYAETTSANISGVSADVKKIVADIEKQKVGETLQKTAANVLKATDRVNEVLATLVPQAASGQRGLLTDVKDTLDNAREATSDLAENMEALKRNFFFRGYFNKRGFFDLDAISLEEYRLGQVAPKHERRRVWLTGEDLTATDAQGKLIISPAGRKRLDEAMVPYLRYAPNTLLMVEGYSSETSENERFLESRVLAFEVRRYLIDRFSLKPNFIGAVPIGVPDAVEKPDQFREGVSLVFFLEKKKK